MELGKDLNQLKRILKAVCDFYNLKPSVVQSSSREENICKARHIFMFIAHKLGFQILPIALTVKRSSDTGVHHGSTKIEELYRSDPRIFNEIESILASLGIEKKIIPSLPSSQIFILKLLNNRLVINYDAETPFQKGQRDKTIEIKNTIQDLINLIHLQENLTL